jgi:hypothetical protein
MSGADNLQSDEPMRVLLLGLVHGTHTAFAEQADDPVLTDVRGSRGPFSPELEAAGLVAVASGAEMSILGPAGSGTGPPT